MKRLFASLSVPTLLLLACTQNAPIPDESSVSDTPPISEATPPPENWIPLEVGLWWSFNLTQYFSDTTIVDSSPHLVSITQDSIIDGNEYFFFETDAVGFQFDEQWVRDSAGYYVNPAGTKLFSYTDFTQVLSVNSNPDLFECTSRMMDCVFTREVPAGTFTCLMREDSCAMYIPSAEPTYFPNLFAAEDVGPVEFTTYFTISGNSLVYRLEDWGN